MVPFFMFSRTQCCPGGPLLSQQVYVWLSVRWAAPQSSYKSAVSGGREPSIFGHTVATPRMGPMGPEEVRPEPAPGFAGLRVDGGSQTEQAGHGDGPLAVPQRHNGVLLQVPNSSQFRWSSKTPPPSPASHGGDSHSWPILPTAAVMLLCLMLILSHGGALLRTACEDTSMLLRCSLVQSTRCSSLSLSYRKRPSSMSCS